ncbi:hypothetical protein PUNSTDRAFT_80582 [Punctularia strigosozonata HHB-11173 SS5]|uniref:uncharacterized protein n=1 Tax=Punctularia strigosozonata (strain HHB-11173) TaxID=741275 RepID=UPI00044170A8|nr:uncharacterized protein PUNSTDRAFT_80582 [Punctularia strigosozonata HHB-11173 SS5]EIN14319.1 hypothetical protein PUNSTDRAFT_80582 [Punctularia strigosozonata HHB-11173 SS5]
MCESRRIPLNVADMPDLCDFTFNSTHRFVDPATNEPTSLQLGVTTNGQGCRLASRIRRDIVSTLPREIGAAVRKVGQLRKLGKGQSTAIEDAIIDEAMRRRMRWVAQVSEYWPYTQIAALSHSNMASILDGDVHTLNPVIPSAAPASVHSFSAATLPGKIFLVGSGPGHPALLTLATHAALTKHAQLVLSDKLVPAAVLALIPSHVEIRIARKFPGNAEGAQQEMMEAAVEAACRGLNVVRLKQGDPMIYGRAGEEIIYFRSKGIEPIVVPGVTSAIAGPTFAGIPVTQRGAAENVIVTTGVGRQGKDVRIPGYERGRTVVMLMGVARLPSVVDAMLRTGNENGRRSGTAFPPHTPVAIIERASMPDQRVTYSTLADIVQAMTSIGEQRPPGMIVVGWAVLTLGSRGGEGDTTILDDPTGNDDEERIKLWLGTSRWRVSEGIDDRWTEL